MEVSSQFHDLADFPPGERSPTIWIGDCVGPRFSNDTLEERKIFTPARNQTMQPVAILYAGWVIPSPV